MNELQKEKKNNHTSKALWQVSQRGMVQMLVADSSPAGLEAISRRMPDRIQDALEFPVVREVLEVAGHGAVQRYVEFELIKLAALINTGGNLTDIQVSFVAEALIREYPNETLADFRLCLQRAAIGKYGDVFRVDPIVIGKWMKLYLDEKYQVAEDELMKSKEDFKSQYDWRDKGEGFNHDFVRKKLMEWRQTVEAAEIKFVEGKTERARRGTGYKDPHPPEWHDMRDKIRRVASEFYKDRYSFSNMKVWTVGDQEVFAESIEDAELIYKQAKG